MNKVFRIYFSFVAFYANAHFLSKKSKNKFKCKCLNGPRLDPIMIHLPIPYYPPESLCFRNSQIRSILIISPLCGKNTTTITRKLECTENNVVRTNTRSMDFTCVLDKINSILDNESKKGESRISSTSSYYTNTKLDTITKDQTDYFPHNSSNKNIIQVNTNSLIISPNLSCHPETSLLTLEESIFYDKIYSEIKELLKKIGMSSLFMIVVLSVGYALSYISNKSRC